MYLKSLSMRGFKSFADHTEFEFGPGLTAIVGPNGVGKSNVADAILWVLGEQSNRAIRTQTSQDVIFAGAEKRSALGLAEVRLLLDNEDEALPIDFTEVEVFHQIDGSTSRKHGGTGIGLSLVKQLVELHGGRIAVSSQASEGATFTVHLPLTAL